MDPRYPRRGQYGYQGQAGCPQPPENYPPGVQGNGSMGPRRSRRYSVSGPPGPPVFSPYSNRHQPTGDPRFPPGSGEGWLHNHHEMQRPLVGRQFPPQPMGRPMGNGFYEPQNVQRGLVALGIDEPVRSMVYNQIPQQDNLPRRRFLEDRQVQDQWAQPATPHLMPHPSRATQNTNQGPNRAMAPGFASPLPVFGRLPTRLPEDLRCNPSNYPR